MILIDLLISDGNMKISVKNNAFKWFQGRKKCKNNCCIITNNRHIWFFSSARFKALYMYEIGRMMQFFDDPSQLKLTLTLSEMTEMFQIDPYYCREEVNQQILRQTTLLKANQCDQG